jgi:hypothetical protein
MELPIGFRYFHFTLGIPGGIGGIADTGVGEGLAISRSPPFLVSTG